MKRRKPAALARRRDDSEDVGDILRESALSAAHLLAEGYPALRAQLKRLIECDEKTGKVLGVVDTPQALAIINAAGVYVTRAASAAAVAQLSRDAGVDGPIIVGLPELDEPDAADVLEIEAEVRR